jgi:precorrin-2 methylase
VKLLPQSGPSGDPAAFSDFEAAKQKLNAAGIHTVVIAGISSD